jgi:hypothetical protein
MKYVYVLEDEAKLNDQIYLALRNSEPDAEIRFFYSMEQFHTWMGQAIRMGNASLFQGGQRLAQDVKPQVTGSEADDHLLLLISKEEWLGSRHMALVRKTRDMFIRKKICTAEDPTRLVISAYENPDFDIKLAEERIICNVLYKPFDELILKQLLHFALKGHHPSSESFVHVVQVKHEVEMTKEVSLEAVGDVGFVTRSPRAIEVGKIAKYYGDVFRGRAHVMARCMSCEPHPEHKDEFQVWFSYLGIPSSQISDIRKGILNRNEPEFCKSDLKRPMTYGKKWLLLDHDFERAKKWKELLRRIGGSEVHIQKSFDDFVFSSDPVESDAKQKEKPWSEGPSLQLKVEAQTQLILDVNSEVQKNKKIFGLNWAELSTKKLDDFVHPVCLDEWKAFLAAVTPKPVTILFRNGQDRFLLKLIAEPLQKGAPQRTFEFIEANRQDKIVWYDRYFENPMQNFCVVVSSQYAVSGRELFWQEWLEKAKKQSRQPRIIVLFDQVPDEKNSRNYTWSDDIFDNTNEPPYIERKLSFMYFGSAKNSQSIPFLSASPKKILVANPVELAEISEVGIVINYYREISLGSFRTFILPKYGEETYLEYRTNCNYFSQHPTEKEKFQNHFVFFGITDALLKKIRVWILENYIQSKQKE